MITQEVQEEKQEVQKEVVIKAPFTNVIGNIISNNSISLSQNKVNLPGVASRVTADTQAATENQKKFVYKSETTILFLQHNEIRRLNHEKPDMCLYKVLEDIMWKSPANLIWIDLSYNYLVTIDDEILKFPNLQNLYLQYNYIKDLGEVRKLQKLRHLKSINLFGNPIEQVPGYRLWILGVLYEDNDCLKKLDQVVITA